MGDMMRKAMCVLSVIFLMCTALPPIAAKSAVEEREIALTFDDGPHPGNTERILDILAKYGVRATFFAIGCNAEYYPAPLLRAVKEGHEIENHSYDHRAKEQSAEDFRRGIERTSDTIERMSGKRPRFFRPPGGNCTEIMSGVLETLGYTQVFWTVDSMDWSGKAPDKIVSSVLDAVRPGAILLFHDYTCPQNNTARALDVLIPALQSRGYRFVTVEEMIRGADAAS